MSLDPEKHDVDVVENQSERDLERIWQLYVLFDLSVVANLETFKQIVIDSDVMLHQLVGLLELDVRFCWLVDAQRMVLLVQTVVALHELVPRQQARSLRSLVHETADFIISLLRVLADILSSQVDFEKLAGGRPDTAKHRELLHVLIVSLGFCESEHHDVICIFDLFISNLVSSLALCRLITRCGGLFRGDLVF